MYAQLGNIVFENLKGFNNFETTGAATYAEHQTLAGKPRLQPTGNTLDEISISMRFHAAFCNPANELKALKKCRDDNEILTLLSGDQKQQGQYVITEIHDEVEDADRVGNIFSYRVVCTLKEYVISDRLQAEQDANRKEGAAINTKPRNKKKSNAPTCPQIISKWVTSIENHARIIDQTFLYVPNIPLLFISVSQDNKSKIYAHSLAIMALSDNIKDSTNDPKSCIFDNVNLRNRATELDAMAQELRADTKADNTDMMREDNQRLQDDVKKLKATASPIINQVITRK